MPRDLDGLADIVVMTVRTALGPVLERLAVTEQCNKELHARVEALTVLRDRVTAVETKSAMPVAVPTIDLAPVLDKVDALGARVAVVETKAAQPPQSAPVVDLSPVLERVAAAEARLDTLGDLRDRVVIAETKSAMPTPLLETKDVDLSPVLDRLMALELKAAEITPFLSMPAQLSQAIGDLRERIAVAEVKAPIAGPPGPAGKDGTNGKDGKDGVDGLGFDDLSVDFDGERTIDLKFERGSQKKSFPITLPYLRYLGVYQEGKAYTKGDVVTWAGSTWIVGEDTTARPGDGSKAYTLAVKKGRDGKDGRDGLDRMPVVSIGGQR